MVSSPSSRPSPLGRGSMGGSVSEPGRDAFHRVRDFAGIEWDAVERVPTRFRGRAGVRRNKEDIFAMSGFSVQPGDESGIEGSGAAEMMDGAGLVRGVGIDLVARPQPEAGNPIHARDGYAVGAEGPLVH
jgi:hypothetical protein